MKVETTPPPPFLHHLFYHVHTITRNSRDTPTFPQPYIESIFRHVKGVGELVSMRGRLSPAKIKDIAAPLTRPLSQLEARMIGDRRLVRVCDLVEGVNEGVYLPVRILTHVPRESQPVCIICVDAEEEAVAVSLYAPSEKVAKLGSKVSVILVDPVWKRMSVEEMEGGGVSLQYSVAHVSDSSLLVNGSLIPKQGLFTEGTSTTSYVDK